MAAGKVQGVTVCWDNGGFPGLNFNHQAPSAGIVKGVFFCIFVAVSCARAIVPGFFILFHAPALSRRLADCASFSAAFCCGDTFGIVRAWIRLKIFAGKNKALPDPAGRDFV